MLNTPASHSLIQFCCCRLGGGAQLLTRSCLYQDRVSGVLTNPPLTTSLSLISAKCRWQFSSLDCHESTLAGELEHHLFLLGRRLKTNSLFRYTVIPLTAELEHCLFMPSRRKGINICGRQILKLSPKIFLLNTHDDKYGDLLPIIMLCYIAIWILQM